MAAGRQSEAGAGEQKSAAIVSELEKAITQYATTAAELDYIWKCTSDTVLGQSSNKDALERIRLLIERCKSRTTGAEK